MKKGESIKRGCMYNTYLRREIVRLSKRLANEELTENQKIHIVSTINRYTFVIKYRFVRKVYDNSVSLKNDDIT